MHRANTATSCRHASRCAAWEHCHQEWGDEVIDGASVKLRLENHVDRSLPHEMVREISREDAPGDTQLLRGTGYPSGGSIEIINDSHNHVVATSDCHLDC